MSELLNCPFCGRVMTAGDYAHAAMGACVVCARCGASSEYVDDQEEAIAAWNRRAPEPAGRAVVDLGDGGIIHGATITGNVTIKAARVGQASMIEFVGDATPDSTAAGDVDALAQEIRRVDGNHSLGAGALAEALMPLLRRLSHRAGDVRDETMVELFPGLPKLPQWVFTYADEITRYMDANHLGHWAINGICKREARSFEAHSAPVVGSGET